MRTKSLTRSVAWSLLAGMVVCLAVFSPTVQASVAVVRYGRDKRVTEGGTWQFKKQ